MNAFIYYKTVHIGLILIIKEGLFIYEMPELKKLPVFLLLIVSISVSILPFNGVMANEGNVKVIVENQPVTFDVEPQIERGRVLVPIRKICEALGAEVTWDDATDTATIHKSDITLKLTVNADQAEVNGKIIRLDVPTKCVNGRILVPLRFIGESLGLLVTWDQNTRTVYIDDTLNLPVTDILESYTKIPEWSGETLREKALKMAERCNEPNPSEIKFVKTTRKKANLFFTGAVVDSDGDCYLVILKGNFVHKNAFIPAGAEEPSGNIMGLVIDASTGNITDFALINRDMDYDLGLLGIPVDITKYKEIGQKT